MAGTVQVTFGANIQPLVDGIESAKMAIQSFIAAFAIDKLEQFIDAAAKMGEDIERTSAVLGASTTQIQQLGYIAKMTGGNQEELSTAIERFQLNLQRAQNPTSQQAIALNALGLSARSLIGLPLSEQMGRMADAISKFADGGNKTAIVMALLGRSGADMIPILDQGRSGFADLSDQAERTGAIISQQTVESLAKLASASDRLRASISGLAGTLTGTLAPGLIAEENTLTNLIGELDIAIQTHTLWEQVLNRLQQASEKTALSFEHLGTAAKDFFTFNWSKLLADNAKGAQEMLALDQQYAKRATEVAAQAQTKYEAMLNSGGKTTKPQAPAMDIMSRDTLNATLSNINAQVAAQNSYYSQQADHINELAKTYQVTEAQKTAMLIAAVNQREAFQKAELQQAMSLQGLTASQYQKFQNELTKVEQKSTADRQKINDQAVAEYAKEWQSALSTVEGSFNSQLRSLLAGTETWQLAWRKMTGDMVIKFIETCETILVRWIALEAAKTAATLSGNATRAASDQSVSLLGSLTDLGNIIKSVGGFAGQTAAAVAAQVAPVAGPAAPAIGAAAGASVLATADGFMGSFDVGAWNLKVDGYGKLHRGEMVVPARGGVADSFRDMLSGGGKGGATVDAGMIDRMLATHRDAMGEMLTDHRRSLGSLEDEVYQLRRRLAR